MDKRVVFAVAGSGKTTHIVDNLSTEKRSLIVTYTHGNYDNLRKKITEKFGGNWPDSITLLTYFTFLYRFCYKPFLSDELNTNGVIYKPNSNKYARQADLDYFISGDGYLYSNRLGFFMEQRGIVENIKSRIKKYFDEFILDEVQDIAGRDFTFLEYLMEVDVNMLFVGDFYQHTFDTSRDGNVNKTLFDNRTAYETRFIRKGFIPDSTTLTNSWRCSQNVCDYIRDNLCISISSHRTKDDNTTIEYIADTGRIAAILEDRQIIKLHYQKGADFGLGHKNWGESKGEDQHQDVCVMLNKKTADKRKIGKLIDLPPSTKNKLYVAITRARGNVYFVDELTK
jgi:hypothetical protein